MNNDEIEMEKHVSNLPIPAFTFTRFVFHFVYERRFACYGYTLTIFKKVAAEKIAGPLRGQRQGRLAYLSVAIGALTTGRIERNLVL